jgi:hypothetical protein
MPEQPRTIDDLDADRRVWIADQARNRSRAHLDADCPKVRNGSEPRTRRVLHPSLQICKHCDPAYEYPRRKRKQDGDE